MRLERRGPPCLYDAKFLGNIELIYPPLHSYTEKPTVRLYVKGIKKRRLELAMPNTRKYKYAKGFCSVINKIISNEASNCLGLWHILESLIFLFIRNQDVHIYLKNCHKTLQNSWLHDKTLEVSFLVNCNRKT